MPAKRILVTGASGYIAGRLIPRLLAGGYSVRVMARSGAKIANRPWIGQVEVVEADVTDPASLPLALEGIDSAYYLIHNMSSGRNYQQAEMDGARSFARAAHQAGTEHIIYLGGLADPEDEIAPHMRSRIETGTALREFPVPVTEFRAGVIAGPGSISFEMIRFICEQFPVMLGPGWLRNRSQPISADNVLDYLTAALKNPACRGLTLEIGGPDVFRYAELMQIYGQIRGLRRGMLLIPGLPAGLMAYMVDKLTPVPEAIAFPLINGLRSDSVVKDSQALEVFPEIQLTGYRQAVADSLEQLHPKHIDRIWVNGAADVRLKHEGFLVESLHGPAPESAADLLKLLDQLPEYQLETQDDRRIRLKSNHGRVTSWLEWELLDEHGLLRQTGLIAPKGLWGFLSSMNHRSAQRRIFKRISRSQE